MGTSCVAGLVLQSFQNAVVQGRDLMDPADWTSMLVALIGMVGFTLLLSLPLAFVVTETPGDGSKQS